MGVINTRKSGQYDSIQLVRTPSGSVIPAATIAPQQTLVGGDTNVQFEGSPIETTNMTHATTITTPAFPGVISGTVNGIGQTTTGYSKKLMIGNSPAVTNTAKKLTNSGNAPMVPMAQSTSANTYFFVNDGGGSGVKAGPSNLQAMQDFAMNNPDWSDDMTRALNEEINGPLLAIDTELDYLVATTWAEAHVSNYICVNGQNYYAEDFINNTVPQDVIDYAVAHQDAVTHWEVTSDAAIQAIASVILNRVGQKEWRKLDTIYAVVSQKLAFDAYGGSNFQNAMRELYTQRLTLPQLQHVYNLVKPMYDSKQVTTAANYYYSPATEIFGKKPLHNVPPSWAREEFYVTISGMLQTDNFAFYDLPPP